MVGINDFESGEICIDGISIKEDPMTCKTRIAYIPDNPDLYEYLTGIQYLNFIADIFLDFQSGPGTAYRRLCSGFRNHQLPLEI